MLWKLVISAPLLVFLLSAPQTQNQRPGSAAPPPDSKITAAPPIKMGLWEATTTTSMGSTMKSRACVTPDSYQAQVTRVPDGCTVTNRVATGNSLTADVSCTMPNGASGTGHVQASFTGTDQVHTTIQVSMAMGGRTMPMTFTNDAHFVQADCGDIAPGTARDIN